MAKKGGNKKKSNARKNQKKVTTTPPAIPSTPEESLPVTPVNALDNDKASVLIEQDVGKNQQQNSPIPLNTLEKVDPELVVIPKAIQTIVITLDEHDEQQQHTRKAEPVPEKIASDLPNVETTDAVPLLEEKKQDALVASDESKADGQDQPTPTEQPIVTLEQDQKESEILVSPPPPPQATENEAKIVQEPHVAEPLDMKETSQLAQDGTMDQQESTSNQEAASVAPVVLPLPVEEAVVSDQTEKETTPDVSTTPSEKEDTPTIRSQSVLTSTNTDTTINEEDIITPKGSLSKNRGFIGFSNKDKNVSKRKSQIISLFKRGADKIKQAPAELPAIQEKMFTAEKKSRKRKSWMFWKSSTAVAGQQ